MLNYNIYRNKKSNSPWITFVHGAGGSSSIWFKQIRFFRRFFNIILIDLRGHGSSRNLSSVKYKSKYPFDDVTNDIIEVFSIADVDAVSIASILHYSYMKNVETNEEQGNKIFMKNYKSKTTNFEIKKIKEELLKNNINIRKND